MWLKFLTSREECLGTVESDWRTTSSPFWRDGRPEQEDEGLERREWSDWRMEGWEEGVKDRIDFGGGGGGS